MQHARRTPPRDDRDSFAPHARATTRDSCFFAHPTALSRSAGDLIRRFAELRQLERGIDEIGRALEIEVAVDVLLHQKRGAAVELFVLLVPAAELRADKVPSQP